MKLSSNVKKYSVYLALAAPLILALLTGAPGEASGNGDIVGWMSLWVLATIIIGSVMAFIATRKHNIYYRLGAGMALAISFMLVWANAAVGVIGSEDNPLNLIYFAVLALGAVRSFIARFQTDGMALAMFTTAIAMILVGITVVAAGVIIQKDFTMFNVIQMLGLHGFFAAPFAVSGFLFRYSARQKQQSSAVPEG